MGWRKGRHFCVLFFLIENSETKLDWRRMGLFKSEMLIRKTWETSRVGIIVVVVVRPLRSPKGCFVSASNPMF